MSITFVSKFGKRPMHLFGMLGTLMFLIGLCFLVYLGIDKLVHVYNNEPARRITDQPSFYISLTTLILGTQLFLAGFLAELISRNSPDRNTYLIEKKVGIN